MNDKNIDNIIFNFNNAPDEERLSGLSPYETHQLIHDPFCDNSPLKFQTNIDFKTLDKVPFFRITEDFLRILYRDKFVKLTPLGALPKKIMVELYAQKFIPEELIESGISKLSREQDSISIQTARFVCEQAGLVKKASGKLTLTKKGEKNLQTENRLDFFKLVYKTFVGKFNWAYHDGYTKEPVSQYGCNFSIYLLHKFGNTKRSTDFYAERYLKVFHKSITFFNEDYSSPQKQFNSCYELRTFTRFTDWFGFTTSENKRLLESGKVTATDLLNKIVHFQRVFSE